MPSVHRSYLLDLPPVTFGSTDWFGTAGDDTQNGTGGADFFHFEQGGNDTLNGQGGIDGFFMGATLTAADRIDGGSGLDTLFLSDEIDGGRHVSGLSLSLVNNTIKNIEKIVFANGATYGLVLAEGNVAPGAALTLDASQLGNNFFVLLDVHKESDAGVLELKGGDGADSFTLGAAGAVVYGNNGSDTARFGRHFDATDSFDGGKGFDELSLTGDYSSPLNFGEESIKNVEYVQLGSGFDYELGFAEGNIGAGRTLFVDASTLGSGDHARIFFSETNGHVDVTGGAGGDDLYGGAKSDTLRGGAGADHLVGLGGQDLIEVGGGDDRIDISNIKGSTGLNHDIVSDFDFQHDRFGISEAVTGIDTAVAGGALDDASFNADLEAAIGTGELGKRHAVLFTPDEGSFAGQVFLIIDRNHKAGYQAGRDSVVALDSAGNIGDLGTEDFYTAA